MQGVALSGKVHGGNQPVSGSVIQLYAAGSGGDGTSASALISATVKTLSDGSFSISHDYTCPMTGSPQVYLVAVGGNPGLSPNTTNNPNLTMMTALGPCSSLSSSSFIYVNELTTVAAVFALSNYMTSYSAVGSSGSDSAAMANAFALADEFVNPSTGTAPGATLPNGYSDPTNELNTLADILAACVNSAGGTAGQANACGMLFTDTTPSPGSAPTDTIGAALAMAKNPNQNVASTYGLITADTVFQPTLSAAPADWTVPLLPTNVNRILFVGDSFTHGRYLPVRTYNSANVTDENYDVASTSSRAETSSEPGPYGGIPGIFKMLTTEAGLNYDVHIEAISSTSLASNYSDATQVVANPQWNSVVLQELSYLPIPTSLSGTSSSDPNTFCNSVKTIEQGVHAQNSAAKVYLYQTWARADEAHSLVNGSTTFAQALGELTSSYHNTYYQAATNDGSIAGVAPAGDAWLTAMSDGYMDEADPYSSTAQPYLWFLYQAGSNPSTTSTSPDYLHPSVYGAYLSALVLYEQITGQNSMTLGSGETAAAALGISGTIAVELQDVAHSQVTGGSAAYTGNPCSIT
jgi:hypothetical protein